MSSTINEPSIPYVGSLPVPLEPGHIIRIHGTVNPSATCFSINLQCIGSASSRRDVALHLSPVFTSPPRLVRNSIQNQQWGPEESHGPTFPFISGQSFEIIILAEADEYKIAVNGQHFTEFKHRLPLHSVTYLAIDGDVMINTIKFESAMGLQQHGGSDTSKPIGFLSPTIEVASAPEFGAHRPSSPYGAPSSLPYPTGDATFGPQPTTSPYGMTSPSSPYGPPASSNPYGPYPQQSNPYGPPPGSPAWPPAMGNPYGPNPSGGGYPPPSGGGYPPSSGGGYPPPSGGGYGYPSQPGGYPQQGAGYPSQGYPGQTGGYPYPPGQGYPGGTSVVYPGQEKDKSGSGTMAGLTALGTALAGGIGGAMMAGKHGKHGHSMNPAAAMMGGGPASMLAGGLLGKGSKGWQERDNNESGSLAGLTTLGTALAGGIGSAMMGGKHGNHGYPMNPTMALMSGGPASMLAGGFLGKGSGGWQDKSGSGSMAGLTALGTALAGGIGGAMMGGNHGKHGQSMNPATSLMGSGAASMLAKGLLGKGSKWT